MDQQQPITAEWCQKMDTRLKWLKYLGVMGKIDLQRGPDGLPCYDGMPLEHSTFLAPPIEVPAGIAPTTVAQASESFSDPSKRIPPELFKRIIEDLQSRSSYTHVAWPLAVVKLQLMHERTPPISQVLTVLESAMQACKSDLDAVTALSATSEPRDLLTKLHQMRTWLAPLQCRLIGIQSGPTLSVTWWKDHGKGAVTRFNNDNLLQCIDLANSSLGTACTGYDVFSIIGSSTRTLTEQFLPMIKKFLQMQQNQAISTKIEFHINQLHIEQAADVEEDDVLF